MVHFYGAVFQVKQNQLLKPQNALSEQFFDW